MAPPPEAPTDSRLLFVEDDPDLQVLLQMATAAMQARICIADSVAAARAHLTMCDHTRFVLDLWLPDGLSSELLDDGTVTATDTVLWTNVHRARTVVDGVCRRHPEVELLPKGDDFLAFLRRVLDDGAGHDDGAPAPSGT